MHRGHRFAMMISRVPPSALSDLHPAVRLAGPARPLIGVEERGVAGAAARGRRATPHQASAPPRLGRPRRPGRTGQAPAQKAARTPVRAENPVHRPDQQSCSPGHPAVMITDHVPAVRLPPDHADRRVAAAVPACGGAEDRGDLDPAPPARRPAAAAAAPPRAELVGPGTHSLCRAKTRSWPLTWRFALARLLCGTR